MQLEKFLDHCFNKDQIKHFLRNYDLKVSGNKSDLIQRLIEESELMLKIFPKCCIMMI